MAITEGMIIDRSDPGHASLFTEDLDGHIFLSWDNENMGIITAPQGVVRGAQLLNPAERAAQGWDIYNSILVSIDLDLIIPSQLPVAPPV